VVRTNPRAKGTITITAVRKGKYLARCTRRVKAGKRVVCRLRLAPRYRALPVKIVVGLKATDGTRAVVRAIAPA
jgi:hypothetical protein